MKFTAAIFISFIIILNSALQAAPVKSNKFSTEIKGMITGATASGIGTTIGVTVVGVTSIFPAVLIGTGIGYIAVKTAKGFKKIRKKI